MNYGYLEEFTADWILLGKAASTAATYSRYIREYLRFCNDSPSLASAKTWLSESVSAETARGRGRALRAFGKWAMENDGPQWEWWSRVPLATTRSTPQITVTPKDYKATINRASTLRDKLVIELLWCTGVRVSELSRLDITDVFLAQQYVVVRQSKNGKPRLAPLSDSACRLIRRSVGSRTEGSLLEMSRTAIQLLLRRLDSPSPHAWRRGWAVEALRRGVSQASLQSAAGWSSGEMVSRYTRSLSHELAIEEFRSTASIDLRRIDRHRPTKTA
jgi:integrase/recombinase XerD